MQHGCILLAKNVIPLAFGIWKVTETTLSWNSSLFILERFLSWFFRLYYFIVIKWNWVQRLIFSTFQTIFINNSSSYDGKSIVLLLYFWKLSVLKFNKYLEKFETENNDIIIRWVFLYNWLDKMYFPQLKMRLPYQGLKCIILN